MEKKYILDNNESDTLLGMVDDCIERGMTTSTHGIDKISDIIENIYDDFGNLIHGVEIEIEVRIKKSNQSKK